MGVVILNTSTADRRRTPYVDPPGSGTPPLCDRLNFRPTVHTHAIVDSPFRSEVLTQFGRKEVRRINRYHLTSIISLLRLAKSIFDPHKNRIPFIKQTGTALKSLE